MGGYLVHFSIFTFAMIGIMFFAVWVYSKTNVNAKNNKKHGGMQIEESLNLTPRKSLHVVSVNGEKFLIAADVERTEFLAKLDNQTTILGSGQVIKGLNNEPKLVSSSVDNVTPISSVLTKKRPMVQGNVALKESTVQYKSTRLSQVKNIDMKKTPFMKSILRKLEV